MSSSSLETVTGLIMKMNDIEILPILIYKIQEIKVKPMHARQNGRVDWEDILSPANVIQLAKRHIN